MSPVIRLLIGGSWNWRLKCLAHWPLYWRFSSSSKTRNYLSTQQWDSLYLWLVSFEWFFFDARCGSKTIVSELSFLAPPFDATLFQHKNFFYRSGSNPGLLQWWVSFKQLLSCLVFWLLQDICKSVIMPHSDIKQGIFTCYIRGSLTVPISNLLSASFGLSSLLITTAFVVWVNPSK